MAEVYQKEGCSSFLPTLITNDTHAIHVRLTASEQRRDEAALMHLF